MLWGREVEREWGGRERERQQGRFPAINWPVFKRPPPPPFMAMPGVEGRPLCLSQRSDRAGGPQPGWGC